MKTITSIIVLLTFCTCRAGGGDYDVILSSYGEPELIAVGRDERPEDREVRGVEKPGGGIQPEMSGDTAERELTGPLHAEAEFTFTKTNKCPTLLGAVLAVDFFQQRRRVGDGKRELDPASDKCAAWRDTYRADDAGVKQRFGLSAVGVFGFQ